MYIIYIQCGVITLTESREIDIRFAFENGYVRVFGGVVTVVSPFGYRAVGHATNDVLACSVPYE